MDFTSLKNSFDKAKKGLLEVTDTVLTEGIKVMNTLPITLTTTEGLDAFVLKSANTFGPSGKEYTKKSLLVVAEPETMFYKKALYALPLLYTKAWSQNIDVKIISSKIEGIDLEKYGVKSIPSMIVFKNREVYKIFAGEENILTIVHKMSLDICADIDGGETISKS